MTTPVVALSGVTKRFGERTALREVSFTLAPGESVGYLGANGAGKSTTLKILAGLLRPDAGTVRLLGSDPAAPGGASRAPVGALLETPGLPPYLHGRDLMAYIAEVRGVPAGHRTAEVERAAARLGVGEHLDRPVGDLSTGLHRRVLIAGALVGGPTVLLLDEPTLGLDPIARRDLRATLHGLHADGTTLFLSTHLLEDVEELCDRVLFLRDGRLVGDEPVHPSHEAGAGPGSRTVGLRFLHPVPPPMIRAHLAAGERLGALAGPEVTVELIGGEARQAAFVAALVGAGAPLVGARALGDTLTERYLAAVGREEDA